MSFESAEIKIAHERDEYSVGPQFVHVPHLRAMDEMFLFACNATVDPEAPFVPQVAHAVESLRVRDVSMEPDSLHPRCSESNTFCGSAVRLELSTDLTTSKGKTNFQRRRKLSLSAPRNIACGTWAQPADGRIR